ncbi:MAG: LexA family protein [Eubacterium sp.]
MTVGERIKSLREQQGMTLEELGNKVGVGKSTVRKWENGMIENMRRDKIAKLAKALGVTPLYLMGWDNSLPQNVSVPAAHGVPILGTICAGDGIYADQNFSGYFFVDHSIKADCCLYVHGDSMVDAGIEDGDIAFIQQDAEIEDGDICGVVLKDSNEAILKKLYRADGHLILQPCNSAYKPIIEEPENVRIVGKMIGIFHKV